MSYLSASFWNEPLPIWFGYVGMAVCLLVLIGVAYAIVRHRKSLRFRFGQAKAQGIPRQTAELSLVIEPEIGFVEREQQFEWRRKGWHVLDKVYGPNNPIEVVGAVRPLPASHPREQQLQALAAALLLLARESAPREQMHSIIVQAQVDKTELRELVFQLKNPIIKVPGVIFYYEYDKIDQVARGTATLFELINDLAGGKPSSTH